MPRFKPKAVLERSAISDLWKHTLSRIPTLYGRLTYLASLRDANSGAYRHHGLSTVFGRDESGKALRESHEQAFVEWLKLSLAEKHEDLGHYLSLLEDSQGANVDQTTVVEHWLHSGIYRTIAPSGARPLENELFCQDLEALLETFKLSKRPGGSDPKSSPPE
jgi:hypothetical protein